MSHSFNRAECFRARSPHGPQFIKNSIDRGTLSLQSHLAASWRAISIAQRERGRSARPIHDALRLQLLRVRLEQAELEAARACVEDKNAHCGNRLQVLRRPSSIAHTTHHQSNGSRFDARDVVQIEMVAGTRKLPNGKTTRKCTTPRTARIESEHIRPLDLQSP